MKLADVKPAENDRWSDTVTRTVDTLAEGIKLYKQGKMKHEEDLTELFLLLDAIKNLLKRFISQGTSVETSKQNLLFAELSLIRLNNELQAHLNNVSLNEVDEMNDFVNNNRDIFPDVIFEP